MPESGLKIKAKSFANKFGDNCFSEIGKGGGGRRLVLKFCNYRVITFGGG